MGSVSEFTSLGDHGRCEISSKALPSQSQGHRLEFTGGAKVAGKPRKARGGAQGSPANGAQEEVPYRPWRLKKGVLPKEVMERLHQVSPVLDSETRSALGLTIKIPIFIKDPAVALDDPILGRAADRSAPGAGLWRWSHELARGGRRLQRRYTTTDRAGRMGPATAAGSTPPIRNANGCRTRRKSRRTGN